MPTVRPRYTLTETDELASALDAAATLWPELREDRTAILRRLVDEGGRHAVEASRHRRDGRIREIHRASGSATGLYPPGAVAALHAEWPE